ncbi:hypothetical protein [Brevundimonas sp. Leaf168]|uniref:hypothetical protein n=1 Tax=Brevundimonas sp. Leaf168 TaxID=1736283 RepID=UPI00070011BC|nr:hypothetical protein [Brevundimonas sp. Leaf168]KQR55989.1 hypothetical protein ASF81_09590 [Brevundimonas sp. Leaf168]
MFGYYRRRLLWITERLRHQEANLDDLANLAAMQKWLIRELFTAEDKQQQLKAERKVLKAQLASRLDKDESRKIKRRVAWLDRRTERLRDVTYVLRCFGDGIAFIYLDRHAVKPLSFEGEGQVIKRSAGSLSGKTGLAMELHVLRSALDHGVPALLCDLTNSIRHGDVCLLGGSDPHLIEVKTRSDGGARGQRQKVDVTRLNDFFENDGGEVLGAPTVARSALSSKPIDHTAALNAVIAAARAEGRCVASPEPGVQIVGQRTSSRIPIFSDVVMTGSLGVYSLNAWKMDRTWLSYRPFTLLIRDPDALFEFIAGDLFLIVVIDFDRLTDAFQEAGLTARLNRDSSYFVSGHWPDGMEGAWGLSGHYADRIGLELMSPRWVAAEQARNVLQMAENIKAGVHSFVAPIPTEGPLAVLPRALSAPTLEEG